MRHLVQLYMVLNQPSMVLNDVSASQSLDVCDPFVPSPQLRSFLTSSSRRLVVSSATRFLRAFA